MSASQIINLWLLDIFSGSFSLLRKRKPKITRAQIKILVEMFLQKEHKELILLKLEQQFHCSRQWLRIGLHKRNELHLREAAEMRILQHFEWRMRKIEQSHIHPIADLSLGPIRQICSQEKRRKEQEWVVSTELLCITVHWILPGISKSA